MKRSLFTKVAVVTATILLFSASSHGFAKAMGQSRGQYDTLDYSSQCAPEVVQGNLSTAARVLHSYAQNELAGYPDYVHFVDVTISQRPEGQMSEYMKVLEINGDLELTEFIGAREVHSKYLKAFSKNTNITTTDAAMVINNLANALRGQIK